MQNLPLIFSPSKSETLVIMLIQWVRNKPIKEVLKLTCQYGIVIFKNNIY